MDSQRRGQLAGLAAALCIAGLLYAGVAPGRPSRLRQLPGLRSRRPP
jgi:hypothetical protein